MRTIKFRAWDKIKKRFLTEEEMNEIGGFYYNHAVSPDPDEFDLQQFTGLFDKNRIEVYEGDKMGDGVVKWIEKEACFKLMGKDWEHDMRYASQNYQVNGNVYENKGF